MKRENTRIVVDLRGISSVTGEMDSQEAEAEDHNDRCIVEFITN